MESNGDEAPINLLVIECQSNLNWYSVFEGASCNGRKIVVEQGEWDDISFVSYPEKEGGCVVSLKASNNPHENTQQHTQRTFIPNFLLIRSVSRGIHLQDSRNLLYGFVHANIPSVNSLESIIMCLEKPTVFGALKKIEKQIDGFPLIRQTYYPNFRTMVITPDFPLVAKVGHAHAGFGKMKISDSSTVQDFKSLCALHGDYFTMEPYIVWDFDMRIQKIGSHYRGFQRVSPNWKGNVGNASIVDDWELEPRHKLWIDACAKLWGGLDILALDLLHTSEGKEVVLELNDTAIGLVHKYCDEDMLHIRDIVILRIQQHFFPQESEVSDIGISQLQQELELSKIEIERLKNENDALKFRASQPQETKKKKWF